MAKLFNHVSEITSVANTPLSLHFPEAQKPTWFAKHTTFFFLLVLCSCYCLCPELSSLLPWLIPTHLSIFSPAWTYVTSSGTLIAYLGRQGTPTICSPSAQFTPLGMLIYMCLLFSHLPFICELLEEHDHVL